MQTNLLHKICTVTAQRLSLSRARSALRSARTPSARVCVILIKHFLRRNALTKALAISSDSDLCTYPIKLCIELESIRWFLFC